MSAPVKCGSCRYQWMDDEDPYYMCDGCMRDYDHEQEMYRDFHNYSPATNGDALKNISQMEQHDELPSFLVQICKEVKPTWTVSEWREWLNKEY